jgi:hypothetical protein
VAVDRHRNDDRAPYVFVTTKYGADWNSLAGNLPANGPVRVIRADPRNPALLYVGTEFGLFLSLDAGGHWHRVRNGFPTVAVHDLVVHPRDRELVIATHGRSLYLLDVAPLQELTAAVLAKGAHLFEVKPATAFPHRSPAEPAEAKVFAGQNPPYGATLYYYLRRPQAKPVRITITDSLGKKIRVLEGNKEAGLHRLTWDLSRIVWRAFTASHQLVAPGDYIAVLEAGGQVSRQKIKVEQ